MAMVVYMHSEDILGKCWRERSGNVRALDRYDVHAMGRYKWNASGIRATLYMNILYGSDKSSMTHVPHVIHGCE